MALIDSGATGNFIDIHFAKIHFLPLVSCESGVAVAALDGHPLGTGRFKFITGDITLKTGSLHTETICLFTINTPQKPIILDLPWLERHNPCISWSTRQIVQWSASCHRDCLLPHSRSIISTKPGAVPTRGGVFPLTQLESETMKTYIEEELVKGFIRQSTFPASEDFFFVKKKDRGLRPCIDYRHLNKITVKFRYPLPLVPAALEHPRSAKYFTKLDLHKAYNLIRIREGDEWKTAFSTTTGNYEYLVMPFGLINSPSVFQAFINDVFQDMLNRWLIAHIDDIRINSDTIESLVQHVRAVLQSLTEHQL